MELVGFDDLQARSAYQPLIRRQGRPLDRLRRPPRRLGAQPAHRPTGKQRHVDPRRHEPEATEYLAHIPGESGQGEAGGAQMVRVCDGSQLPRADKSKVYLLRTAGNTGHEIWDVTDPSKPRA